MTKIVNESVLTGVLVFKQISSKPTRNEAKNNEASSPKSNVSD